MLLNVLFPLLVVLKQPLYFLIVGLVILLFGTAKAACCTVIHRKNKIMLSLYPVIFHLCFAVFYFSSSSKVLVIAEIACLIIYFIGSLHEFLTIIFDIVAFIYRIVKANCKSSSQIAPCDLQQADKSTWYCNIKAAGMNRSILKHGKITIKD